MSNPTNPVPIGSLPSVEGSRVNDVKVADLGGRSILVHSNEPCDDGRGGFEIYDVSDPTNAVLLASVQTDDINPLIREEGVVDVGVHNLFLWSRGGRDYVAANAETFFGNLQIFDITDPSDPELVGWWGAEEIGFPGVDFTTLSDIPTIVDAELYMLDGYGASANRFLHDFTVSADGSTLYYAGWDAGLVRLDITDPTDPQVVSVALDPTNGSPGDGEVNSHSVWPNADGTIVVEGEEDFNPFRTVFRITSGSNAGEYPAAEGAITTPIVTLPGRTLAGPTVYVGLACDAAQVPAATDASQIALIQRGACFFSVKAQNALDKGYAGIVVFNSAAGGDSLVVMGGDPVNIPGVFVGRSTGLTIAGVTDASQLTIGAAGESVSITAEPEAWGGLRIWDFSDPANPELLSTFDTTCSLDPVNAACDPRGTYTVHNVVVEGNRAYVSWYSDGVLVLDISNPSQPREIARFNPTGSEFEAQNGGIQDVWGIWKNPNQPWIYASDRNGGLYVLKEYGQGSGRVGRP